MASLVLVTGASGFLGSHIVNELLQAGYNVRAVARSPKVPALEARYAAYGARVQVVGVDDLVAGDFGAALDGVYALIHVASPIATKMDAQGMLDAAVKGTLNVVGQAIGEGVKKIVVTSSATALTHPARPAQALDRVITDQDWSDVTEEEVIARAADPFFVYFGSKSLAEKALWGLVDAHPDVDVTTILPPFVFGPLAPGVALAKGDIGALSTNFFFHQLLAGPGGRPMPPLPVSWFVDVRDTARAHVVALRAVKAPTGAATADGASAPGRKRIIVSGGPFTWHRAVRHLRAVRPALADRLPDPALGAEETTARATLDTSAAREVLRIEVYRSWESVVEDAVDSLIGVEKEWAARE